MKKEYKSMFPLSEEERRIDELHGIKRNPLLGFIVVTISTVLFWSFIAFMIFGCEVTIQNSFGEYIQGIYVPKITSFSTDGTTYVMLQRWLKQDVTEECKLKQSTYRYLTCSSVFT